MSEHATVVKDGFTVPLIGIPVQAVLEICDLCGDEFPVLKIEYNGIQMLCERCRKDETKTKG